MTAALVLFSSAFSLAAKEHVWLREEARWTNRRPPRSWEKTAKHPGSEAAYRLAMMPLMSVECGVFAIKLVVVRSGSDENLLGERDTIASQPSVLTAEELQFGISKSRFGATRRFKLAGKDLLQVTVKESALHKGGGMCEGSASLEALTVVWELSEQEPE